MAPDPTRYLAGLDIAESDLLEMQNDRDLSDAFRGRLQDGLRLLEELRRNPDKLLTGATRPQAKWLQLFSVRRPEPGRFLRAPSTDAIDPGNGRTLAGRVAAVMPACWTIEYALAGSDNLWKIYVHRRNPGHTKTFYESIQAMKVSRQKPVAFERHLRVAEASLDEAARRATATRISQQRQVVSRYVPSLPTITEGIELCLGSVPSPSETTTKAARSRSATVPTLSATPSEARRHRMPKQAPTQPSPVSSPGR